MQVKKLKIVPKACMQPFEVNPRSALAMREVEKEHTALSTFSGYKNIL